MGAPPGPATAELITDSAERRQVLAAFYADFVRRSSAGGRGSDSDLEDWVADSPLARVAFDDG